jgi:outer membrane protein assembly factor BamA
MKTKTSIKFNLLYIFLLALCLAAPARALEESASDSLEEKRHGWIFFPIIFYSPETKTGFGAGVGYFFREPGSSLDSRPSSVLSNLIYTQRKQITTGLLVDIYLKDEAFYPSGEFGYRKFPDKFYGIGNRTSEDAEEDYTPEEFEILLQFQARLLPGLYLGPLYKVAHSQLIETSNDGSLATGEILGSEGGSISGLGFTAKWDTRDNVFYPSAGSYHQLFVTLFSHDLGSDYDFKRYILDLRHYIAVTPNHILALRLYGRSTNGDVPFQQLSELGGANLMRGYYQGRYRDHDLIALQAEYRLPLWWRFGLVGFAGTGDVSSKVSKFRRRDLKTSIGFGFRFPLSPEEKLNLRFDFGFTKETSGFYINFTEAF